MELQGSKDSADFSQYMLLVMKGEPHQTSFMFVIDVLCSRSCSTPSDSMTFSDRGHRVALPYDGMMAHCGSRVTLKIAKLRCTDILQHKPLFPWYTHHIGLFFSFEPLALLAIQLKIVQK